MIPPFSGSHTCVCGRNLQSAGALTKHEKQCSLKGRKRLAAALGKAKEIYQRKKRRRGSTPQVEGAHGDSDIHVDPPTDSTSREGAHSENAIQGNQATQSYPSPDVRSGIDGDQLEEHSDNSEPLATRRTRRSNCRLPARYRDILPEAPMPLPPPEASSVSTVTDPQVPASSAIASIRNQRNSLVRTFKTQLNKFCLYRVYNACSGSLPTHDPHDPSTVQQSLSHVPPTVPTTKQLNPYHPYPNQCSLQLGQWYWNQSCQKSKADFKQLLHIIGDEGFRSDDVRTTNWKAVDRQLGGKMFTDGEEWVDEDGEDTEWHKSTISISVPMHSRCPHPGPLGYSGTFYHRSLISVIQEKVSDPSHHRLFHHDPYELQWRPPHKDQENRVYGDLFTSDIFLQAHRELQNSSPEPNCDLPRVVVGLMFASDATQLSNFGSAKLWPLYLFFGNESKYARGQPRNGLCTHVAYFESLPDDFKDFVMEHAGGKHQSDAFYTHCHREFFHEQWKTLLDKEFVHAYEHGIAITCCDGIARRFYPRIFTYSADYPEKILIACIRNLGRCLCPRCLVPKDSVELVGTELDMTQRILLARADTAERREKVSESRKLIYESNYAVNSLHVERLLKAESLVPTVNAFSDRLSHSGFNFFLMLIVDLLHEFELGVWKAVLIHLLRILESVNKSQIDELDRRFRQVPIFGRDTIRRFSRNTSELKQMAARDYEDILQCSMPVFHGLFPEPHDTVIQQLLCALAHWHAFAKLRVHTDATLNVLEMATRALGDHLRTFVSETCPHFTTRELPREAEARHRRQVRLQLSGPSKEQHHSSSSTRRPKTLNLQTYKMHALGDYVSQIRLYGTTDSYSTQTGEQEHRVGKKRFARTSGKNFIPQLAQMERRQTRIHAIHTRTIGRTHVPEDPITNTPESHHHIGMSQNHPEDVSMFVNKTRDDLATKDFLFKLKAHLLPRARSDHGVSTPPPSDDADYADGDPLSQLNHVVLKGNRIYRHFLLQINYTTYDVRRNQDVVNSNTDHRDLMLLSRSTQYPYSYARVLGIFHANVVYVGPDSRDYVARRMEFLWVRWFELVSPAKDGLTLDTLRFVPMVKPDAFGFVNPSDVIRGCHLIPVFHLGRLHPDRIAMSKMAKDGNDWKQYCVNRFVDRDMVVRYHWGEGIGHTYAHSKDYSGGNYVIDSPAVTATVSSNSGMEFEKAGGGDEDEYMLEDREELGWHDEDSAPDNSNVPAETTLEDSESEIMDFDSHDVGTDPEWADSD